MDFVELLQSGGIAGIALWVVLAFSVIAIAVAIERFIGQWQFVARARALSDVVLRCLGRGAVEEASLACVRSDSPIADVFTIGFEKLESAKPEHVVSAVHRERQRVSQDLRTRLWMLGTIGATAPFVGLTGTVFGIMNAMGRFKGSDTVTFSSVSAPISEALIVTAVGIVVAVEAVVLFNYFSQRGGRIATEMKLQTEEFLEQLLDPDNTEKRKAKKSTAKGDESGAREAA
jgi:biopolymer transport protein ExbB/TolQ